MSIHELVQISSIYLPQSLAKLLDMESFHRLQPVAVWSACTLHAETQTAKGCVSGTGQLRGGSAEEVNLQRWQGGKAEKNCSSPGFCVDLTSRNVDWYVIEGSLEVKFSTIWTDEKQSREEAERREEKKKEDQKRESLRRKKIQMWKKVGKSRNTVFLQWFGAPEGRKVGSLKRQVRSQLARWEMKICTLLWRKHISKSKCTKHLSVGPLLEVAMSKKCTPLWREAHVEVKMYKTLGFGPLLEVQMSKKCMPLWREAHFQVKMYKTPQYRTTFGSCNVEKVHAVVARSTFRSENVQITGVRTTFGASDVASLHYTTLHYTRLHYTTLHSTTLQLQLHN